MEPDTRQCSCGAPTECDLWEFYRSGNIEAFDKHFVDPAKKAKYKQFFKYKAPKIKVSLH